MNISYYAWLKKIPRKFSITFLKTFICNNNSVTTFISKFNKDYFIFTTLYSYLSSKFTKNNFYKSNPLELFTIIIIFISAILN